MILSKPQGKKVNMENGFGHTTRVGYNLLYNLILQLNANCSIFNESKASSYLNNNLILDPVRY
jgi:hypothetical protein